MKYLLPFLLICSSVSGQKLITNEKDKFTGKQIKRTSWESIGSTGSLGGYTFYTQLTKIDTTAYFDLRVMYTGRKLLSVHKDDELMFMLQDSSIVKLKSSEFKISSYGGGATGLSGSQALGMVVSYYINEENLKTLTGNIIKIRWYTTDGYVEHDIKGKNSNKINELVKLISQ